MARTKRNQRREEAEGSQRQARCCTVAMLNAASCVEHAPRIGIEEFRSGQWVLRG